MTIYDNAPATTLRMRDKFGLDATLRRVSSNKDRATGKGTSTTTDTAVKVAHDPDAAKSIQGLTSVSSAFTVWSECQVDDVIVFANKSYKITAVDEFAPAGVGLYWTAIVKSGA